MDQLTSGLQLELRCVLCKRLPSVNLTLFEMQNHLSICEHCLLKEQRLGKHVQGVNGQEIIAGPLTKNLSIIDHSQEDAEVSEKDIFQALEISPVSSEQEVQSAIEEKMRYWMRQPPSEKRESMRVLLEEWHEELVSNQQFLEQKRLFAPSPLSTKQEKSTLSLAGNDVETLKTFVELSERSQEAWQEGIDYLQSGELEYWVSPLTKNRLLAQTVHLASESSETGFQTFNTLLYHLLPERPFRFYKANQWESLETCSSVATLEQLAIFCDRNWELAKYHLYSGALLTWLEYGRGCTNLQIWYQREIAEYGNQGEKHQSLGLELLLEHILPTLVKPELLITLDGHRDEYLLPAWDREIAHQPLTLTITNLTRGAAVISIKLLKNEGEPVWLSLQDQPQKSSQSSQSSYLRPGEVNPFICLLSLEDLHLLGDNKKYQYRICIEQHLAWQQEGCSHEFPIRLQTLAYQQGLRRHVWRLGLRGGWPGLWINFVAAIPLAFCILLLLPLFFRSQLPDSQTLLSLLQIVGIRGIKGIISSFLGWKFLFIAGSIGGLSGAIVGWRKGHSRYPVAENRKMFMQIGFWLSALFFPLLFFFSWTYILPGASSLSIVWIHLGQAVGSLVTVTLIFIIVCLLSVIRSLLERFLRRHYALLLHPKGSI